MSAISSITALVVGLTVGTACLAATPARAVAVAAADAAQLADERRALTRYLWFPAPSEKTRVAALQMINTALSHAAAPLTDVPGSLQARQAAWPLSDGLLRIDLAIIGGDAGRVERLRRLWEALVDSEPYFTIEILELQKTKHDEKLVARRVASPTLPELRTLGVQTHSALPIVRGDWLIAGKRPAYPLCRWVA
ncbi:MAG: hypothetical protein AB7O68_23715 [Pirellulales bacterium]